MTTCLIADVVIGFQMRKPNGMSAASRKARRQSLTAKKHDEQSEREVSAFSGVGVRGSCRVPFRECEAPAEPDSCVPNTQTARQSLALPGHPSREVTPLRHSAQQPARQNQEGSTESRPPGTPIPGCFPRCSPRR